MSPGRPILAIEISNPSGAPTVAAADVGPGVALGQPRGDGEWAWVETEMLAPVRSIAPGQPRRGQSGHDDDLMPAIDRLFARRGLRARDLEAVAVSIGPGGYTSLRVACATGKMIAEAAGVRCLAVPTARVAALARGAAVDPASLFAVTLAAKGETTWAQCFHGPAPIDEGRVIAAEGLAALVAAGVRCLVADRFLPESIRLEAVRLGLSIVDPALTAEACLQAAAAPDIRSVDPAQLVPLYPREPDAVTLWRARGKG